MLLEAVRRPHDRGGDARGDRANRQEHGKVQDALEKGKHKAQQTLPDATRTYGLTQWDGQKDDVTDGRDAEPKHEEESAATSLVREVCSDHRGDKGKDVWRSRQQK